MIDVQFMLVVGFLIVLTYAAVATWLSKSRKNKHVPTQTPCSCNRRLQKQGPATF